MIRSQVANLTPGLLRLCVLSCIFAPAESGFPAFAQAPPPQSAGVASPDSGNAVRDPSLLSSDEVTAAVAAAIRAADTPGFSVAGADRAGRVLAVWQNPGATGAPALF